MNGYSAVVTINVAICFAIAVACYATSSGLPLFGLLFLMEMKVTNPTNPPTKDSGA